MLQPGSVIYIECGNGFLPDQWYGDRCVVLKQVGAFVIFTRDMDGNTYALPEQCVYPACVPAERLVDGEFVECDGSC